MQKLIVLALNDPPPPGLSEALRTYGCETLVATSEARLLESVDRFSPECTVVLTPVSMDPEATRIAGRVRSIDHTCPLLIMTSDISASAAICAMRAGASDMLERDAPREKIVACLKSLTSRHSDRPKSRATENGLLDGYRLAGTGVRMQQIRTQIGRIASADVNVLITGETGTGKELVAHLIHTNSRRSARPFVALNCAAVPDTLLESELFGHERGAFTGAEVARDGKLQHASGGTLFLDEVGDMSLIAQAKILRAVESRVVQRLGSNQDTPVQVRLLAATNQKLEMLTQERKFREDLYFRLNVVRLELPALRDRLEDIPELVEHTIRDLQQRHRGAVRRVEDDLIRRLQAYHWPGNVRELRNVLESMMVLSSSRSIGVSDLPSHVKHAVRSSSPEYGDERSRIIGALTSADWNRNKAAEILCCSRMTLYRKMVKYSIA